VNFFGEDGKSLRAKIYHTKGRKSSQKSLFCGLLKKNLASGARTPRPEEREILWIEGAALASVTRKEQPARGLLN
jgi:hypothetical protein